MQRRGLLVAVAGVVSVAGCNDAEPTNGTPMETEETPDERVEIIDSELVRRDAGTEEATVAIEGRVRVYEADLQHVELRARFFDEEGNILDTTFDRLQELGVGTRRFSIRFPHEGERAEEVDGFDITVSTVV